MKSGMCIVYTIILTLFYLKNRSSLLKNYSNIYMYI